MTQEEQLLVEERLVLKQTIEFYEKDRDLKQEAKELLLEMKARLKLVVHRLMSFLPSVQSEQKMKGFATREEAVDACTTLEVTFEADPISKGKFTLSVPEHPDPISRRYYIHAKPTYDHRWTVNLNENVVTLQFKKPVKS